MTSLYTTVLNSDNDSCPCHTVMPLIVVCLALGHSNNNPALGHSNNNALLNHTLQCSTKPISTAFTPIHNKVTLIFTSPSVFFSNGFTLTPSQGHYSPEDVVFSYGSTLNPFPVT